MHAAVNRNKNKPARESRRVDFPDPEGPIIAMIRPGSAYPFSLWSNLRVGPSLKLGITTVKSSHAKYAPRLISALDGSCLRPLLEPSNSINLFFLSLSSYNNAIERKKEFNVLFVSFELVGEWIVRTEDNDKKEFISIAITKQLNSFNGSSLIWQVCNVYIYILAG